MEKDDLKRLWQERVAEEIPLYAEAELRGRVLRRARRSVRRLYPMRSKIVVGIAVCAYLGWLAGFREQNTGARLFYVVLMGIVAVNLIWVQCALVKFNRCRPDMPVREWLGSRVGKLDRSLAFWNRYRLWIRVGMIVWVVGIGVIAQFLTAATVSWRGLGIVTAVGTVLGMAAGWLVQWIDLRRLERVRGRLLELCGELDPE